MDQRDQRCKSKKRSWCIDAQPPFRVQNDRKKQEGEGRKHLPSIRAENGWQDHARGFCAVPCDKSGQAEIDDQEERSIEVDGEHHPPIVLSQQRMGEQDLSCERQRHRHQIGTRQPRCIAPARWGACDGGAHALC
jgi:hypothetical protein